MGSGTGMATTSGSISDAPTGGETGTEGTASGGADSTGGDSSTGITTAADTTTGEPPHETNWDLCEITVDCDLPIVDEPKRSCHLTVTEGDGYVVYDGDAGFENRGRSSQGWPKHQYAVELWQTPNIEFVAPGSVWRYNDGPSSGGANWMSPGFDDSGWAEGPAPLGYGVMGPQWQSGGEPWATSGQIENATIIGFGPSATSKYITTWFRQEFEVDTLLGLDPLRLHVRGDDGMVVYINGTEAARFNMPSGPIDDSTLAASTIESLEEVEFSGFPIEPSLLVEGTNVVAVEVHQIAPNSSDKVLDLSLSTKPPDAATNFYEFGREEDWVFNGMYFDLSLYRNKFAYDLFQSFDPVANYGPETHYCQLTLNGDWHGIYTLGEKIKRDDDRVDIVAEMGAGESFIFKSDITQRWVVTNGVGWQLEYPSEHGMSESTAAGLNEFMAGFSDATQGVGNIWDYVDMASIVDWVLLQEFARNGDAYSSSMHIYRNGGGLIHFVPWDFDIGMGGGCGSPEGWNNRWNGHWLNVIAGDPAFQAAFVARYTELRKTVMSLESITAQLDGYVETMTPEAITQNFDRWPIDEIIGGDDWVLIFRENCPVETWDEEHELMLMWITERLAWMDENIQDFG